MPLVEWSLCADRPVLEVMLALAAGGNALPRRLVADTGAGSRRDVFESPNSADAESRDKSLTWPRQGPRGRRPPLRNAQKPQLPGLPRLRCQTSRECLTFERVEAIAAWASASRRCACWRHISSGDQPSAK